ncbi:uncharacterized protein TrAtP1_000659 [Trichoderma atroviride]|nr:hypothetical protein TrAtP1_000659 [Trichoderma atroviride]
MPVLKSTGVAVSLRGVDEGKGDEEEGEGEEEEDASSDSGSGSEDEWGGISDA